jgi:hypothetical protein
MMAERGRKVKQADTNSSERRGREVAEEEEVAEGRRRGREVAEEEEEEEGGGGCSARLEFRFIVGQQVQGVGDCLPV